LIARAHTVEENFSVGRGACLGVRTKETAVAIEGRSRVAAVLFGKK